jgi:hemolysin activation/secretion protein
VWVGQVAEVRTIAKGERFSPDESINHSAHTRIRAESPIQAAEGDEPAGLFRRKLVDDYVSGLSLHPTRRVEVSLASAGEPGKVVLDYLVNEVRPWQIFAQSSNTGSKATGVWRTRLGFQHTQFTNHDDILNLDVVSSGSWDTKAGLASYSFPLLRPEKLRLRVFGSAGDFKIGDLGFAQTKFTGDNWQAGTEATYRLRVRDRYGVAALAGLTYNHYNVGSSIANTAASGGRSGFLIPFVGARVTRQGERIGLSFAGRIEHSVDGIPNESATSGIEQLGRSDPAPSWTVFKGGVSAVAYLETLFQRLRPQGTAASPGKLAHEMSASLRGQYVMSRDRLVPQEQDLLGGAYSVRGYPDSILSADDSVVASAEYTFHVGRVYSIPPIFGADIGLLLRGFTDFGHSWVTPAPGARGNLRLTEQNRSMWSAGAGTEISIRNQISLRCDVGYVLRDLKDPFNTLAERGDIRAHFIGSLTW